MPDLASTLSEQAAAFCESTKVPGYVAGVYHAGREIVIAHGLANAVTGAPMREDTGFLFGSITKVMTATLVLQQVERGAIDLDERVTRYLPELRLATAPAAEIRVRHLLSHTNGIDADLLFPDVDGRGALAAFIDAIARHAGALFAPGEYISYSNGGMNVAGRLLEVVTGTEFPELLARDVYAPAGMTAACTSAADAILRSTAVGHFFDPSRGLRRTDMFKLPDSWAPAGSTPIGTIRDLLAFARTHLDGGVSPAGRRVLSRESTARMQTVQHDMKTPNASALGLGWPVVPFGATTALVHSGASPGGVALLVVVPAHELAFAAFGNDPRAIALHDKLLLWLLRDHLAIEAPSLVSRPDVRDLAAYAGTYRSNQLRVDVTVVDDQLEEAVTYEPLDDVQRRIFTGFSGGLYPFPPRRFVPVGKDLFAPAGMPLDAFTGAGRALLVSYHGFADGRATYRCGGGRLSRRADQV